MNETPRFAADRMVGRLARWLRLLGADVSYHRTRSGPAALRLARAEQRPLLTRDKRLRTAPDVLYLQANALRDQLFEVLRRYPFDPYAGALSRCSQCNQPLEDLPPTAAQELVPPYVFKTQSHFAQCPQCGKIYWPATHVTRMANEIATLQRRLDTAGT
ncbi:MAG TPA: Mut7-C RNAse domain-containing protein [Candidatus Binataceae bacterium]|nr:Mut7-C RNAse domain-containing protein [Candidatus Binataceae bacterium]